MGIGNGAAVFDMRIYLLSLPLGIIPYYKNPHLQYAHHIYGKIELRDDFQYNVTQAN